MEPEAKVCQECAVNLTADSPQGLCPKCLLKQGLDNTLSQTPSASEKTVIDSESPKPLAGGLPREGQRFGDYQLIRLLGQGGMGAVYEAEHLPSERRVALKMLNHALDSPEARKRFLREGQLAASINHPNSVYVFGTEEIEGIPAISMELAPGGTLKDRVQEKGPLPVAEAVDVILQVIGGLEAAQANGVLHRDIKPSNCFVDTDGTVKIGDFGLSISTVARAETNLTITGTFQGTPAFSSPEQLRGDELDVRSDIYSVGVTLFYLLTGKTPFEGDNMVKLLAMVLEKAPESPARLRSEIPQALAEVVLRCLEKQRSKRPEDYGELRKALLPFTSTAPKPAPLGLRFLAGVVDSIVLGLAVAILRLAWFNLWEPIRGSILALAGILVIRLFYFGLLEGIWGASVGKALFGLRVVRLNRGAPGVAKALVRATIYVLVTVIPLWLERELIPEHGLSDPYGKWLTLSLGLSMIPLLLLLFSTSRRSNGFAAIHDLLTNTRVVLKSANQARPVVPTEIQSLPSSDLMLPLGPYQVLKTLRHTDTEEFLLGYDARLLRKVWIRKLPIGEPPVPANLRNIRRAGRLRWLNGRHSPDGCWDAYEAVPGKAFLDLLHERQPWSSVRYWLLDLAEELSACGKEESLPAMLALDRVWITADGRAKLLDFPAPDALLLNRESERLVSSFPHQSGSQQPQLFLKQVALAALEGRIVASEEARYHTIAVPLPLHTRAFLQELLTVPNTELVARHLESLVHKIVSISRQRRLGMIGGCWLPSLLIGAVMLGTASLSEQVWRKNPNIVRLRYCLRQLDWLDKQHADTHVQEAFRDYIADQFRQIISDPVVWSSLQAKLIIREKHRKMAEQILASHPNASEARLRAAEAQLKPFLDRLESSEITRRWSDPWSDPTFIRSAMVWIVGAGCLLVVIIPSLIGALLFRGGLLLRGSEIGLVARDGSPASRVRILWRSLFTGAPLLLVSAAYFVSPSIFHHSDFPFWNTAYVLLAIYIPGALWCARTPERGPQDRLAGTWLVPR